MKYGFGTMPRSVHAQALAKRVGRFEDRITSEMFGEALAPS